jgi:tubulin polyglutamylase TTLL9
MQWDLYWGDREWVYEIFDTMHLESTQRLNHFRYFVRNELSYCASRDVQLTFIVFTVFVSERRNSKELCRKDLLVKNLKKKKRQLEKDGQYREANQYDFFPVSFTLPREYAMFVEVRGSTVYHDK